MLTVLLLFLDLHSNPLSSFLVFLLFSIANINNGIISNNSIHYYCRTRPIKSPQKYVPVPCMELLFIIMNFRIHDLHPNPFIYHLSLVFLFFSIANINNGIIQYSWTLLQDYANSCLLVKLPLQGRIHGYQSRMQVGRGSDKKAI